MVPDTLWILIAGIIDNNAVEVLGTFPDLESCKGYARDVAGRDLKWEQDKDSRHWYAEGFPGRDGVFWQMVEVDPLKAYSPGDGLAECI